MEPQNKGAPLLRVCLCGRPNVGKSTLFNRLVGKRKALVLDLPGVTRDVKTERVEWNGRELELADLAGIELWGEVRSRKRKPSGSELSKEQAQEELRRLSLEASLEYLKNADLVLFVIDGRSPLMHLDEEIARLVRSHGKRVLVVLSKIEGRTEEQAMIEASALGWGEPIATSAEHNTGIGDLEDKVLESLFGTSDPVAEPELSEEEQLQRDSDEMFGSAADDLAADQDDLMVSDDLPNDPTNVQEAQGSQNSQNSQNSMNKGHSPELPITLGVYGRPNVGKSTIVNRILGSKRMITSPIAGTTVDTVDSDFEHDGKFFRIVDTAGIRRRSKTEKGVEVLSVLQAMKSLERVDIALFVIDGFEGVTDQDEKVAGEIVRSGRSVLFIVNKWDLCGVDQDEYAQKVREKVPFLDFAPVLFVSAERGEGLEPIYDLFEEILVQRYSLASTHELNRILKEAEKQNNPKDARFFYSLQTSKNPPTITIQVNHPDKVHFAFERYVKNELRKRFGWMGSPLKLVFKAKRRDGSRPHKPGPQY